MLVYCTLLIFGKREVFYLFSSYYNKGRFKVDCDLAKERFFLEGGSLLLHQNLLDSTLHT